MILVMYIVLIFIIAITITYIGTGTLQHCLVIWQLVARLDENVSVESTEEVVVDRLLSRLAPDHQSPLAAREFGLQSEAGTVPQHLERVVTGANTVACLPPQTGFGVTQNFIIFLYRATMFSPWAELSRRLILLPRLLNYLNSLRQVKLSGGGVGSYGRGPSHLGNNGVHIQSLKDTSSIIVCNIRPHVSHLENKPRIM